MAAIRSTVRLDAISESEWVARHVAALGHVVIVAAPDFAVMHAMDARRVKTDRRDALVRTRTCYIAPSECRNLLHLRFWLSILWANAAVRRRRALRA